MKKYPALILSLGLGVNIALASPAPLSLTPITPLDDAREEAASLNDQDSFLGMNEFKMTPSFRAVTEATNLGYIQHIRLFIADSPELFKLSQSARSALLGHLDDNKKLVPFSVTYSAKHPSTSHAVVAQLENLFTLSLHHAGHTRNRLSSNQILILKMEISRVNDQQFNLSVSYIADPAQVSSPEAPELDGSEDFITQVKNYEFLYRQLYLFLRKGNFLPESLSTLLHP